jgi:hypothetical protein
LTAGTRRSGSSKVGPFHRAVAPSGRAPSRPVDWPLLGPQLSLGGGQAALTAPAFGARPVNYAGRHIVVRDKTARKLAVPAAAVAVTIAAGAAAYPLVGTTHPDPAQLNAAIARHDAAAAAGQASASTAAVSAGTAGAATIIKVTTAAMPSAPARPQGRHAKPATATPTTSAAKPDTVAAKTTGKHAAPSASAAAASSAPATARATTPIAATLTCGTGYSLLPENVSAIVSFLLAHGYSDNAAAGIAGNIYQESTGDPEAIGSGGGGLIGWTPLPSGYVTGDVSADLKTQLDAVLTYNGIWSQYIPELNAASTPADAADIYVTDFERAGIPAAATREASAQDVASACGI